jgi:glycosyltransferase involved in cell wall biosynthesis
VSKICHILGDSRYGGGSKIVLGLCRRALTEEHEVFVLTTDPLLGDEVSGLGGSVVNLDCVRRPVRPAWDLVGLVRLVRHLRSARYDLVHTHTSKAGMIGRLACRIAGVPAVLHTVHGFAFHEQSRKSVVILIAAMERVAATWCDRVVTVSRFHWEWALRLGIAAEEKIIAIPNGIEPIQDDSDRNRQVIREGLGVGSDELLVLSLGRLADQKGFADLIASVPSIRSRVARPVKFRIAGTGPREADLRRAIGRHGVDDCVELIGFCRDVPGLLGAADLIIQPSLWEGLSISMLEAMSARKAIITTAIESNVEIVGDSECAVLVPTRSPKALATAAVELLNDDAARGRIATRAREVFDAGYTCDRMLDAYMGLYRALLPEVATPVKKVP